MHILLCKLPKSGIRFSKLILSKPCCLWEETGSDDKVTTVVWGTELIFRLKLAENGAPNFVFEQGVLVQALVSFL